MATKKRKSVPPEQFDKENKVLELRRSGETWERIALAVGYANASGAQKAYARVVSRVQRESVDEIRDLELDRLDRLQRAFCVLRLCCVALWSLRCSAIVGSVWR